MSDLKKIQSSKNVLVFANKSTNLYEMCHQISITIYLKTILLKPTKKTDNRNQS